MISTHFLKFANELKLGRQKGSWVKTIVRDVFITTHQINVISNFIKDMIEQEQLQRSDIIKLKYLKRIDQQQFSLYKILCES